MEDINETRIGRIANYYGGLWIKRTNNICCASIESYDGHEWDEIPLELFQALLKYEQQRGT